MNELDPLSSYHQLYQLPEISYDNFLEKLIQWRVDTLIVFDSFLRPEDRPKLQNAQLKFWYSTTEQGLWAQTQTQLSRSWLGKIKLKLLSEQDVLVHQVGHPIGANMAKNVSVYRVLPVLELNRADTLQKITETSPHSSPDIAMNFDNGIKSQVLNSQKKSAHEIRILLKGMSEQIKFWHLVPFSKHWKLLPLPMFCVDPEREAKLTWFTIKMKCLIEPFIQMLLQRYPPSLNTHQFDEKNRYSNVWSWDLWSVRKNWPQESFSHHQQGATISGSIDVAFALVYDTQPFFLLKSWISWIFVSGCLLGLLITFRKREFTSD